jgi:steroid delta-isomerase-like uncharacterized protein
MSTEENKAIVRRFYEVLNTEDLTGLDELFATNYILYLPGRTEPIDREGAKQFFTMVHQAFPDLEATIEALIAEGDQVALRFTVRATHQGVFRGIPPTGRQATWTGIETYRITAGKIAETWISVDLLSLMQQFGAVPAAVN